MEQDAGQPITFVKVDGGPSANGYLMQHLADLLQVEVRVAAAREATAIGAASLASHSALGTSLEELAARWRAEAVYAPRMATAIRDRVPGALGAGAGGGAAVPRGIGVTWIEGAP